MMAIREEMSGFIAKFYC